MICYLDRSFCSSDCVNTACYRNFSPDHRTKAEVWWGEEGAPVCYADFRKGCAEYKSPEENDEKQNTK